MRIQLHICPHNVLALRAGICPHRIDPIPVDERLISTIKCLAAGDKVTSGTALPVHNKKQKIRELGSKNFVEA